MLLVLPVPSEIALLDLWLLWDIDWRRIVLDGQRRATPVVPGIDNCTSALRGNLHLFLNSGTWSSVEEETWPELLLSLWKVSHS